MVSKNALLVRNSDFLEKYSSALCLTLLKKILKRLKACYTRVNSSLPNDCQIFSPNYLNISSSIFLFFFFFFFFFFFVVPVSQLMQILNIPYSIFHDIFWSSSINNKLKSYKFYFYSI